MPSGFSKSRSGLNRSRFEFPFAFSRRRTRYRIRPSCRRGPRAHALFGLIRHTPSGLSPHPILWFKPDRISESVSVLSLSFLTPLSSSPLPDPPESVFSGMNSVTLAFIRFHPDSADLPPKASLEPWSRQVHQGSLTLRLRRMLPEDANPRTFQDRHQRPPFLRAFADLRLRRQPDDSAFGTSTRWKEKLASLQFPHRRLSPPTPQ
jgi:hypothetical protein